MRTSILKSIEISNNNKNLILGVISSFMNIKKYNNRKD